MTRPIISPLLALLWAWPLVVNAEVDNSAAAVAPTDGEVLAFYPAAAKAAGIEGSAEIGCQRDERGMLVSCAITSETPKGQGFGFAAIAIAAKASPFKPQSLSTEEMGLVLPYRFTFKLTPPSIQPDLFHPSTGYPHWLAVPNANDVASAFPGRAARQGVSGRTSMRCRINASGSMERCSITSESPADFGLGEATLKLASKFKISRFTPDGRPTYGGYIVIPMRLTAPQ